MQTTKFLLAAACGMAMSTAAHAQLLGGGGLGSLTGGVGQTVGGTLGGSLGARTDRSIDRRSGRASAGAGLDGAVSGALDSATSVTGPDGVSKSVSASGKTDKRVSKSAHAEADGPGTDDGRDLLSGTIGAAGQMAGSTSGRLTGAAQGVRSAADGTTGGSATGSGSGAAGRSGGELSGSGSVTKSLTLLTGTNVEDARGRTIGRIQDVKQTASGAVDAVVVRVGDKLTTLPAGSLSASGDIVTTTMTKGEVMNMASDDGASAASSTNDEKTRSNDEREQSGKADRR